MEEWHQKLHNNTSPDDVIICQALIDYIDSGLDISAYWATLKVWHILVPIRSLLHGRLASGLPTTSNPLPQQGAWEILVWGPIAALLYRKGTVPQVAGPAGPLMGTEGICRSQRQSPCIPHVIC